MPQRRSIVQVATAFSILAGAAGVAPAAAIDLNSGAEQNRLRREGNRIELKILEDRLHGQAFLDKQQGFREQDRKAADKPLDLKVPRLRTACRTQVFGNSYLASCR